MAGIQKMYNEDQKYAFVLASYPKTKMGDVVQMFTLFAAYEESWKMDLVLQSIEPLQAAFNEITAGFSPKRKNDLLLVLKNYREWYLKQSDKRAVYAGVALLKVDSTLEIRRKYVSSPRHLRMALDEVLDDPSENTLDCIYRGYLWLAFTGVPSEEITSLTTDEVDFYEMRIHHKGIDYDLPQEGVMAFHKLCELTHFRSVHKNPDYEHLKTRISGDELLRGSAKTSLERTNLPTAIFSRFSKSKYALDYGSVFHSGIFCRLFELERMQIPIAFKQGQSKSNAAMPDGNVVPYHFKSRYLEWKEAFRAEE